MSVNQYSVREEVANAVTHALGMVFGIVGLVLLLLKAAEHNADPLTITSMAVYGASIIVLFWPRHFITRFPHRRPNVG